MTVRFDVRDSVGWITMDRPQVLNASNVAMKHALSYALSRAEADDRVRAVVLTGAGRAFCVGGDRDEVAGSADHYEARIRLQQSLCMRIAMLDKPVIAAINGYALGGGLEMALLCDIRIAARSAKMGTPAIRIGSASTGGLHRQLARIVGIGRAMHLVLASDPVDAQTAERIGLVAMVVDDDALHDASHQLARRLGDYPPGSIAAAKQAFRLAHEAPLAAMMAFEAELAVALAYPDSPNREDSPAAHADE